MTPVIGAALTVLLISAIALAIGFWFLAGKIAHLDRELDCAHFTAHFAVTALQAHLEGKDVTIYTDLDLDMPIRTEPEE